MKVLGVLLVCQSCRNEGPMPVAVADIPEWCTCDRSGRKGGPGPYHPPPGVVIRFTFETKDDAAFRERCRLTSNAERQARDAITEATYYPSGRKRPAKFRKAAIRAYNKSLRALEALQAQCSHPSRSIFNRIFCDVCKAQVECDVEHYRHLVREAGVRFANRVAV